MLRHARRPLHKEIMEVESDGNCFLRYVTIALNLKSARAHDECNRPRAKYHIGRNKEEQWIVGGITRPTSSSEQPAVFIVSVPDRRKDTLLKSIKTWVIPGSIIITDCWNGYIDLEGYGYHHFLVNHSQHYFVDPYSLAHTQRIESL